MEGIEHRSVYSVHRFNRREREVMHEPRIVGITVECDSCNTQFDLPVINVEAPEPTSKGQITVKFGYPPDNVAWMIYMAHFLEGE